jgi:hypothetical protein
MEYLLPRRGPNVMVRHSAAHQFVVDQSPNQLRVYGIRVNDDPTAIMPSLLSLLIPWGQLCIPDHVCRLSGRRPWGQLCISNHVCRLSGKQRPWGQLCISNHVCQLSVRRCIYLSYTTYKRGLESISRSGHQYYSNGISRRRRPMERQERKASRTILNLSSPDDPILTKYVPGREESL